MYFLISSLVSVAAASIVHVRRRHRRRYGVVSLKEPDKSVQSGKPPVFVVCLDLDETLVSDEAIEATKRFNEIWIKEYAPKGGILVYNTGRSLKSFRTIVQRFPGMILRPQVLVAAEGHSIYWFAGLGAEDPEEDPVWAKTIDQGWDVNMVRQVVRGFTAEHMGVILPPPQLPVTSVNERFRESVITEKRETAEWATQVISERLAAVPGLQAQVNFCGGAALINHFHWVGVIPIRSGKGHALTYVLDKLGGKASHTLVAGDSGNDVSMFNVPGVKAVVVANAQLELLECYKEKSCIEGGEAKNFFLSKLSHADAIIDGLKHFTF